MARKKKAAHHGMTAEAATEGYSSVLRDMFSIQADGPALMKAHGADIMRMRKALEVLCSGPDGKTMATEKALFLLIQTMTWMVENMVAKLVEDCGHDECARARMIGLCNAMGIVSGELLSGGERRIVLDEGVTH